MCSSDLQKIEGILEEVAENSEDGKAEESTQAEEALENAMVEIANRRIKFNIESKKLEAGVLEGIEAFQQKAAGMESEMVSYYEALLESGGSRLEEFRRMKEQKQYAIAEHRKPGRYSLENAKEEAGKHIPESQEEAYRLHRALDCLFRLSYGGMFSYKENLDNFLGEKLVVLPKGGRLGRILGGIREDLLGLMQQCAQAVEYEADGIQEWMYQYQKFHHLKLSRSSIKDIDREAIRSMWDVGVNVFGEKVNKKIGKVKGSCG